MSYVYVLIVDDNPQTHSLLDSILKPLELATKHAFNGKEALEMTAASPPSLIILDLAMPGMDGLDTLEQLSEDSETSEIPVIIYSAVRYVERPEGHEWPPQVVATLNKVGTTAEELRKLVRLTLKL